MGYFTFLLFSLGLQKQYVFYAYRTSQFDPAAFQMLHSRTWPGAITLNSIALAA